jgi:hypothetical protein
MIRAELLAQGDWRLALTVIALVAYAVRCIRKQQRLLP